MRFFKGSFLFEDVASNQCGEMTVLTLIQIKHIHNHASV